MKILKDSFIYLFGELAAKALPFLLLPYLTRKFGAAGFGELSYYQTICSLLIIVFGLSQDGALTRYFYVYGKRNLNNIMLAGYGYTALMATLALIFAAITQSLTIAAVICAAAAQTVLGVQLALRQCQKRALPYTLIQTASGVFTSLLTVLILETTVAAPIAMRFAALFLGNAAVSIAAYCLIPKTQSRQNFRKLKLAGCYVLTFGLPLVLHHASGFMKGQLDRIVIYQHYPAEQLGIYSAGLQLANILSILLLAVNKATVPHYYQALKQGSLNAEKVRKFALFSLIAVPIPAFIAFLLPEKLYVWILGAQYLGVKYYILLFLLGFGFTIPYYLLVNFLFYHGENKRIATISVLSTVVYLVALFATSLVGIQWIPLAMIIGNITILPILYHRVSQHIKAA
ncbi:oligosaccharide flippase family protein [Kingella kingae]|uniref:oligosaccharide flippase family protein n=1 Tax=Kingella kingae TaxID=504 RepID=UPI0013DEB55E|nr:oligosaccharide flippase family protein [Kingella kingae]MBD3614799.1 oligosaccharide flippase family protein [Kingella kingae]MBD3633149.1 oligosaccharide flippase family protein [Kingella kingae]MBD3660466.1 oligosaccharide flippase family protein [Kingella kingae]QIF41976.1 oligosaccharide flippase family protein [Kingella kingae]